MPIAGGLLDQPAGLMKRMNDALKTYELIVMYDGLKADKAGAWIMQHKQEHEFIMTVKEELRNGNS